MGLPPIPVPDTLKGVDDLIRSGLEAYRESWFNWLLVSTGLVGVGLLFEAPELVYEIVFIIRRKLTERKLGIALLKTDIPEWVKIVAFFGWFLIVAGVAGEFVADSFVSKADGFVQKFDEILLADAQTKTGVAFERAAAAYLNAETAKLRTAGLEKEAEELHKHNLELEALIQPRDLSLDEQKAIADALELFRGRFVLILEYQDPEAMRFGNLIMRALTGGAEDSHRGLGPLNVGQSPLQEGIAIPPRTGVEVTGDEQKFVKALSDALFSKGHIEPAPKLTRPRAFAGGFTFTPTLPMTPDAKIYVGLKPLKFLP